MNHRWCEYSSRMRILGLLNLLPRRTGLSMYVTRLLLGLPIRKRYPLLLILTICGWRGNTLRLLLLRWLAQLILQCRLPEHAQLLLLRMADM